VTTPPGLPAYLGIDLGTSGLKLVLINSAGTVIGEAEASYRIHTPQAGHAETDPAEWARALEVASTALFGSIHGGHGPPAVASIGVTGQMHGVVLVGDNGQPVRPAVLWPDQRAVSSLRAWQSLEDRVRQRLGNPLVAGMAGPILSWLREHEPRSMAATAAVMSPKDWLRASLTSDRTTDRSDASATLLWDVVSDTWSGDALQLAGVSVEQLPTVVPSDQVVGTASLSALRLPGDEEIPVVAGGADTACALAAVKGAAVAAIAAGRFEGDAGLADLLVVNVGTGIQILRPAMAASTHASPVTHLYADTEGGWYEMLAIKNGGIALSWVQAQLAVKWAEFVRMAASARPGSAGALFVPFLTGERGAVASASSSASWQSLTPTVGRAELARAAFEGLAFTIRRGIDVIGAHPGPVLLCGGGSREPWMRQLIVDVVGRPICHVQLRSASAVGAAMLAARGAGGQLTVPARLTRLVPSPINTLESAYKHWLEAIQ
jgi:xylulokinase